MADKQIACALGVSYWTVRFHVNNAMRAAKAKSRAELAAKYTAQAA